MREAVPPISWIGFLVVIVALLCVDLSVLQRDRSGLRSPVVVPVVLGSWIAASPAVSRRETSRAPAGVDGLEGDEPPTPAAG